MAHRGGEPLRAAGPAVPVPAGGFSSTVEGNVLTYEQQVAKLRLIVETAEEVWG